MRKESKKNVSEGYKKYLQHILSEAFPPFSVTPNILHQDALWKKRNKDFIQVKLFPFAHSYHPTVKNWGGKRWPWTWSMYAFSSSPILPNNFFLTVYLLRENWIYRTRGFCYYYLFQVCYKKFLFRGWQTLILQLFYLPN